MGTLPATGAGYRSCLLRSSTRLVAMQAIPRPSHVGSFHRPESLILSRQLYSEKKCTIEELRASEDEAIRAIVALQIELGLNVITDGEFRRPSFTDGIFQNLDGLTLVPDFPIKEWKPYVPGIESKLARGLTTFPTYLCDGKIKRRKAFYVDDFKYLASLVPPEKVKNIKITFPSPIWWYFRHGDDAYSHDIYQNADEYFDDFAKAYREEIQELYSLGCRQIQLDDPWLCFYCDENIRANIFKAGKSADEHVATFVRALNACMDETQDDITVAIHLCRSSFNEAVGSYDWLAERIFTQLNANTFYLEFHDPNLTGDFDSLKHFPSSKRLVLGLLSAKEDLEVEDSDYLTSRVHDAASSMVNGGRTKEEALNQLSVSPHCGFSPRCVPSSKGDEVQRRKLQSLVELSSTVWKNA